MKNVAATVYRTKAIRSLKVTYDHQPSYWPAIMNTTNLIASTQGSVFQKTLISFAGTGNSKRSTNAAQ